jgi:GntR family transcriptional repressor for pyruvate dehydrogenase complex
MAARRPTARTEDGRSGGLLSPVNDRRISALIVDQVRSLIHEGKLTPGDRLPPEREMCERFGVSRVTVREALRVLEAGGLVEIRVGAHGGAFVTTPTSDRVGASITDLLTLSSVSAADVTEVRLVLEVGIIPLLCANADEEDFAALQAICDRQEEAVAGGSYDVALSAEFHPAGGEHPQHRVRDADPLLPRAAADVAGDRAADRARDGQARPRGAPGDRGGHSGRGRGDR